MTGLERCFTSHPARVAVIVLWLSLGALGGSFAGRFQNRVTRS
jgi:hypothetical protein